jgi:hypothetical protein
MSTRQPFSNTPTRHKSADGAFFTERLPLAIYLHATQRLPFLCCEAGESGKVRFVFDDPTNNGSQVELDFDRGAKVEATAIFASQKFLRRKMSEVINNRKHEERANHE